MRARLTADSLAPAQAIALADAFSARERLPDAARERLAIVIEEWVVNIVEHGEPAPDSLIEIDLARADDLLRLSISDAGQPFDPREIEHQGPNMERGGGAGLALVQAWCRIADYRWEDGRNRTVLELSAS